MKTIDKYVVASVTRRKVVFRCSIESASPEIAKASYEVASARSKVVSESMLQ